MGSYINTTSKGFLGRSASEKCDGLIAEGAKEIKQPKIKLANLVVVVDNGHMGAARYVETDFDFRQVSENDGRKKRWFIWNNVNEYAE